MHPPCLQLLKQPVTHVQNTFGSAQLPEELATICNGLTINNTVCQGVNYDSRNHIAVFKGQPPNKPVDLKHYACNNPDFSFWALNAGEILTNVLS